MLTKKQKRQIGLVLFIALAGFFGWVLIFSNMTIGEETVDFVVKQITWTTKFVSNLQANWVFYLMVILGLGTGYYFLTAKKR